MSYGALIAALIGAGASIYSAEKASSDKKRMDKKAQEALANQPDDKATQSSKNLLVEAQVNKNAINPATQLAYKQAQQGAANQSAFAQRNATSGSEALSVGSTAQNNLQSIVPSLAADQTQFNMANRGQYMNALQNMSEEERRVFESRRNKNNDLMNYYIGRVGAANANQAAAINGGLTALGQAGAYYDRQNRGTYV